MGTAHRHARECWWKVNQVVVWTRTNDGTKGTVFKIDPRACFTCVRCGSLEASAAAEPIALLFI